MLLCNVFGVGLRHSVEMENQMRDAHGRREQSTNQDTSAAFLGEQLGEMRELVKLLRPGQQEQTPIPEEPRRPSVVTDKNGAVYINIRGLLPMSNRTKVPYLATSSSCSMIVLMETHLSPSIQDAEVAIAGYTLFKADWEERTHGC